ATSSLLVFAWDSYDSWSEVVRLREQILETKQSVSANARKKTRAATRVPMVIAGNKCDREHRNHDESNSSSSSSGGGVGGLGGSRYRGLSIRRRLSEAYGMVAPNVRRPSIRTDLLILRAKTSLHLTGIESFEEKKPRREVSCVIQ
ncbi:hypothetical protein Pmani_011965, partial [Petrolisthes manimaculis]